MIYPNTECPHDCYKPDDCDGSCTHPVSKDCVQSPDNDNEWAGFHTNPRPIVAPQQPAPAHKASPADAFRNMFAILHNLETSDLPFMSAEQRLSFSKDPAVAILRLDDARLDALYALVSDRQPERYRGIV